jgi:sporulation protein YlmC with PRC-barrel domain
MTIEDQLDLAYAILDLQLIDCDGRRCGRVDDIAFDDDGRIAALLSGAGAWPARVSPRLRPLLRRLVGDVEVVRVPWSAVEDLGARVALNQPASDLGLARGDDELRWLLSHLPWGQERSS